MTRRVLINGSVWPSFDGVLTRSICSIGIFDVTIAKERVSGEGTLPVGSSGDGLGGMLARPGRRSRVPGRLPEFRSVRDVNETGHETLLFAGLLLFRTREIEGGKVAILAHLGDDLAFVSALGRLIVLEGFWRSRRASFRTIGLSPGSNEGALLDTEMPIVYSQS
jgi:hypothetical protein